MQKSKYLLILIFLFVGNYVFSQSVSVSGKIVDSDSKQAITGASVYIDGTTLGTSSNSQGEFSIKHLHKGDFKLVVSFSGYKSFSKNISLSTENISLSIELEQTRSLIDEIVVTGTATRNKLSETPVQTDLFTERIISSVASNDFEDLMTKMSPSFDFSPNKMGSRMQLNGLGNDYILILIDGKRLYGDVGGQTDLSRINPANIKKIEVVKGASSSLYGSEAIAGVINIITKKTNNKLLIENDTRLGDYGDWQQTNTLNFNWGKLSSYTVFSRRHSDGWQLSPLAWVRDKENPGHKKLEKTAAKSVNEYTDYNLNQKFIYNLNKNIRLRTSATFHQKDIVLPIAYKRYGYFHSHKNLSLGGDYIINADNKISLDVNYDRYRYFKKYNAKYNEQYLTDEGKNKQVTYYTGDKFKNSDQKKYSMNINGVFKLNESNKLNTGIEYYKEFLESQYRLKENEVDAYALSAFIQDEINIDKRLFLVAGLRYSHNQAFSDCLTPKLSLLYKLSDFNFRATYGAGYKAPTLKELYLRYESSGMGSHNLYLGNEDLKAQSSDYYSVSAEYNSNNTSISVSSYINKVYNLIAYRQIDTKIEDADRGVVLTKENYNISDAETKGLDVMFNTYLGADITLGGGYSYVDARDLSDGSNLEATSHHYANISSSWSHKWNEYQLMVNLIGRIQSKKFFDNGNTKAHNIWRFNTTHKLAQLNSIDLKASVGVDNVFDYVDDSPYGENHATLSPGRTFYLSLNIRFSR